MPSNNTCMCIVSHLGMELFPSGAISGAKLYIESLIFDKNIFDKNSYNLIKIYFQWVIPLHPMI
jgi:hypothetical protein